MVALPGFSSEDHVSSNKRARSAPSEGCQVPRASRDTTSHCAECDSSVAGSRFVYMMASERKSSAPSSAQRNRIFVFAISTVLGGKAPVFDFLRDDCL